MKRWQYLIIVMPAPGEGSEGKVLTHGNVVLATAKADMAAHTMLMSWRGQGSQPAGWAYAECWARQEDDTSIAGKAFGRDWP